MRITDQRYNGEIDKFHLAIRMIRHEARTGTIRKCTGFTEDRIRKIYGSYFKCSKNNLVKRRRGKSPTQIAGFVSSSNNQFEATVLACLFVLGGAVDFDAGGLPVKAAGIGCLEQGKRVCAAFERYRQLHPNPHYSFERAWGLFSALTHVKELGLSSCESCDGHYIHDRYALNYHLCPGCELLDAAIRM